MDQISFLDAKYVTKKRQTRRERFLKEMESVAPWKRLESRIRKHYGRSDNNGRPRYPLSTMLRIHCMQHGYGMSDPAMEGIKCRELLRQIARSKEMTIYAGAINRDSALF